MANSLRINGPRTALDILREDIARPRPPRAEPMPPAAPPATVPPSPAAVRPLVAAAVTAADYIKLENIVCKDADGNTFEEYPELYVRKDVFKDPAGQILLFKPYDAAQHCEQQGTFNPSFALSCNIVAALYARRSDAAIASVLQQYKDKGNGNGWHSMNTLINFGTEKVIHYPLAADFGQPADVNIARTRHDLSFSKATLQNFILADALRNPASVRYAKQLTGLSDPSVLVEMGNYFGKPAKVWFPWNGQQGSTYAATRAAWLGCNGDSFYLDAGVSLNNSSAARGVRLGAP